jgi:hypothetical protein
MGRPRRARDGASRAAKSSFRPFAINAQAPDEGNMHTLLHWGTRAKQRVPEAAVRQGQRVVLAR